MTWNLCPSIILPATTCTFASACWAWMFFWLSKFNISKVGNWTVKNSIGSMTCVIISWPFSLPLVPVFAFNHWSCHVLPTCVGSPESIPSYLCLGPDYLLPGLLQEHSNWFLCFQFLISPKHPSSCHQSFVLFCAVFLKHSNEQVSLLKLLRWLLLPWLTCHCPLHCYSYCLLQIPLLLVYALVTLDDSPKNYLG